MDMIIKNMDEIFKILGVCYELLYENEELNQAFNNYKLLDEKEDEILKTIANINQESILYDKYYWYTKFMKYHKYNYGEDAGIEQKQFRLIEQMSQQLQGGVDFTILQNIEETMANQDEQEAILI